ncbi:MAG: hypothetical protein KAT11_05720 [Phycisphaerae bacterium]|nr:hypothetical protein [Phycisphaerae bacterium]
MIRSYSISKGPPTRQRLLPILLAALLLCLPGSQVAAESQDQWLGYRSSAGAAKIVGKTPGQNLELTDQRPQGVLLPQFAGEDPLFAKWKTPMTPAGFLWLAIDKSTNSSQYGQLFIDSDADASLADETPVRARSPKSYGATQSADFRQVKVLLTGEDGPVALHLNLDLWLSGSKTKRLVATAAGWYEGDVKIEGIKHHIVIFDANANGTFDDSYLDFSKSDQIKVATDDKLIIGRVGKYIQLGDKLHRLVVARDGAFVRFSQPKAVVIGTVRVSGGLTLLSAGGTNGLFFLSATDGQVKLPLGKYRVNHWEVKRKDKAGLSWELVASGPSEPIVLKVAKDTEPQLDLGEPLTASVSVRQQGSTHRFSDPKLSGQHGERIILTRKGSRPPAPKLHIKNADGSYDRRFSFEYG